ncbi:transposase [Undibacterium arcticum]
MRCSEAAIAPKVRDNAHAGKTRVQCLAADAFIGRFLLHVLPPGFKRIRHYGLLAGAHKKEKLAQCRAALGVLPPQQPVIETTEAFMRRVAQVESMRCTCCANGQFQVIGVLAPARPFQQRYATGPPP